MLILPLSTPSSGGLPAGVTSPGDGALNYVTGALTASRPSINVAQIWNNASVPFDADLMDITDTASAAGSTVFRRRVGGADRVSIRKDGWISTAKGLNFLGSGSSAMSLSPQNPPWLILGNGNFDSGWSIGFNKDSGVIGLPMNGGGIHWQTFVSGATQLALIYNHAAI